MAHGLIKFVEKVIAICIFLVEDDWVANKEITALGSQNAVKQPKC